MEFLDFSSLSPGSNLLVLAAGSVVVWLAGTKLSVYAEAIAVRTGLGRAFVGALLLGGATSLPELATTLTASSLGNAALAVGNLFGGLPMQIAILAVIDFAVVRGALTFFSPSPVLLLGGVLLVLQTGLALAMIAAGELLWLGHVGLWPLVLFAVYVISLVFMQRFESRESWIPAELPEVLEPVRGEADGDEASAERGSARRLAALFALHSLLVLAGGWAVSYSADAFALQTGIGSGFVGATLVSLATSLPELSTTIGAVRVGAYTMAIANIFGTNSLRVALLLPADLAYRQGRIIDSVDQAAVFLGALGIVVTCLYLWGLLERRNRTVLRMGVDSALVLLVYAGGLVVLYLIS